MLFQNPLLLALISGILIGFSYIPFYAILGLVALIPLWLAMDQAENWKQVFARSWISQFVLSLIGFHWIAITAHDFGYMPWWLSIIVLLVFASVMHIHFSIAALIWFKLKTKFNLTGLSSDILKAVCLFGMESYWPMIFPWNFGYTWMTSAFPIAQTAEIIGFVGLSFVSILANAFAKQIFEARKVGNKKKAFRYSLGIIWTFIVFSVLGHSLKSSIPEYTKSWKIGVVQANIGNFEKVQAEHGYNFQRTIIDKYVELTEELLKKNKDLDFVVWPETAIPLPYTEREKNGSLMRSVTQMVDRHQTPLLAGSFFRDRALYNGAGMWLPESGLSTFYRKTLLLAFGETVPFTEDHPEIQRKLKKMLPALSFFGKGSGPVPMELENSKIGVNICYEGIHPKFVSDLKNMGSQILVNLTNDSWFGQTFEPYQHMYMTLARSIEHRIPSIRSTNTGISTAIGADGKIHSFSPMGKEWAEVFQLNGHDIPPKTIYQKIAGFAPVLFLLFGLSLVAVNRTNCFS